MYKVRKINLFCQKRELGYGPGNIFLLLVTFVLYACSDRRVENIFIKGSDTEVNLVVELAEAYMAKDPAISLAITGGGSGVGIAALLNGKTQLANSSRLLSQAELNLAKKRGIEVHTIVFAVDALAVIVNKAVPVSKISLDELAKIYSGEIRNWQSLGGKNASVSLYGRQNSSGTYIYFRDAVIKKEYSSHIRELNGTAQLIEAVSQYPNGIGYVGVGYIRDLPKQSASTDIKVLNILDAHTGKIFSPFDKKSILAEEYPLIRPLYPFTNGKPQGKLLHFIRFELSKEGQQMVASAGYFPISKRYKDQNKRNGITL